MLVKVFGSAVFGVNATTITIEVNLSSGVNYILVGLPDNAVKESQKRIVAALKNCNFRYPKQEFTVNLAPADIRKEGSAYDLPIAVGILACTGQVAQDQLDKYLLMGELSLDGGLQPVRGVLPIAIQAFREGFKGFILPKQNAKEAAIVAGLEVYGVEKLSEVVDILNGENGIQPLLINAEEEFAAGQGTSEYDF